MWKTAKKLLSASVYGDTPKTKTAQQKGETEGVSERGERARQRERARVTDIYRETGSKPRTTVAICVLYKP